MMIGIIAAVVLVVLILVSMYNGLIKSNVRVDNAWAQIDVQLQRRNDLIPNLVETVRGYASHEKSTLEAVINARAAALTAKTPGDASKSEGVLGAALGKLLALSEAYPDLKANSNFLSLQSELSNAESRISYARNYYNESVQIFNSKIQSFPTNVFARNLNFTKRDFFVADSAARTAPKVQF
jgi:LemA protein